MVCGMGIIFDSSNSYINSVYFIYFKYRKNSYARSSGNDFPLPMGIERCLTRFKH